MKPYHIYTYPDPILKKISEPVQRIDAEFRTFIKDLDEIMHQQPGGIGIAAPQVGVLKCVIIIDVSRKIQGKAQLVMINPVITAESDFRIFREGCMSIPDFTANVRRANTIKVEWFDLDMKVNRIETDGLEAVCIQHEVDHLNGILFLDRVSSLKIDVFRRKK